VAITLANGLPRKATIRATLSPDVLGREIGSEYRLYVEGSEPRTIAASERAGNLRFRVDLPAHSAGVITIE